MVEEVVRLKLVEVGREKGKGREGGGREEERGSGSQVRSLEDLHVLSDRSWQ